VSNIEAIKQLSKSEERTEKRRKAKARSERGREQYEDRVYQHALVSEAALLDYLHSPDGHRID